MEDKQKFVYKNYTVITRCEFSEEDMFSVRLVEYYKQTVSTLPNDGSFKEKMTKFDGVMRKYVEDYNFSKKLKKSLDLSKIASNDFNNFDGLVDYMFKFLEKYNNDKKEVMVNTRWI